MGVRALWFGREAAARDSAFGAVSGAFTPLVFCWVADVQGNFSQKALFCESGGAVSAGTSVACNCLQNSVFCETPSWVRQHKICTNGA